MVGKITIAAVNSSAGSTKSVCLPPSPYLSTWLTPRATPHRRKANIVGCQLPKPMGTTPEALQICSAATATKNAEPSRNIQLPADTWPGRTSPCAASILPLLTARCPSRRLSSRRAMRRGANCSGDRSGEAHGDTIVLDLVLPPKLVGKFVPSCGDVVGALLCGLLAGERLLQLVFRDRVVLEDARDARLDRRIRVIVRRRLRVHVGANVLLVVAGKRPQVEVGVALPIGLEARRIGGSPH